MARAYSDDLRRKLLESYAAGKGTLEELADHFGVSARWAWKVQAAYKRTGSTERTPQRRHGVVRRDIDERVRALVGRQPDMVLREMQAEFATAGQTISITQLWRVLQRLGLRLKKSRSTPPSATPKSTTFGAKRMPLGSGKQPPKT